MFPVRLPIKEATRNVSCPIVFSLWMSAFWEIIFTKVILIHLVSRIVLQENQLCWYRYRFLGNLPSDLLQTGTKIICQISNILCDLANHNPFWIYFFTCSISCHSAATIQCLFFFWLQNLRWCILLLVDSWYNKFLLDFFCTLIKYYFCKTLIGLLSNLSRFSALNIGTLINNRLIARLAAT